MNVRTKLLIASSVLLLTSSLTFLACQKNSNDESQFDQSKKTSKERKEMKITGDYSDPNARAVLCENQGGVDHYYSVHFEWELATCRSNCERGIGFRCGRRVTAHCNNGQIDIDVFPGSCPNGASSYPYATPMRANSTFYTDGSVKLTFLEPMPAREAGNVDFEIEVSEIVALPDGILLNGVKYDGFRADVGIHKIDYSDGPYGSVILPGVLIPQ